LKNDNSGCEEVDNSSQQSELSEQNEQNEQNNQSDQSNQNKSKGSICAEFKLNLLIIVIALLL
jgi:predicted DNA repair protein MutK